MKIQKRQTLAGILIILATISFTLSQYYSTEYQEGLINNLGLDVALLQIRGAMNEYLLRGLVPENYSNKTTGYVYFKDSPLVYDIKEGLWFEKEGNINAYFNEIDAFNNLSYGVGERSWIYTPFPDEVKAQLSEELNELLKDKFKSNRYFLLGLILSVAAVFINFDILRKQE